MRRYLALTILAAGALTGQPSQCSIVLTATGRNELKTVSIQDQRAYWYRKVCSQSDTNADLQYKNAKEALGLTFADRRSYCDQERGEWANYNFSYIETSSVVEKALSSWLECMKLYAVGLELTPTAQSRPETFVFSVQRRNRAKGTIRGVTANAGTKCYGYVKGKEKLLASDLNFQIPVDEIWSVRCERQAANSSVPQGVKVYPGTLIVLDTTEGPFTFELDSQPLAAEHWAAAIESRLSAAEQSIKGSSEEFAKEIAKLRGEWPNTVEALHGGKRGNFASDGQTTWCNEGTVLVGLHITGNTLLAECGDLKLSRK